MATVAQGRSAADWYQSQAALARAESQIEQLLSDLAAARVLYTDVSAAFDQALSDRDDYRVRLEHIRSIVRSPAYQMPLDVKLAIEAELPDPF